MAACVVAASLFMALLAPGRTWAADRPVPPRPLEGRPGHIHVVGDTVTVATPAADEALAWVARDDQGAERANGSLDLASGDGTIALGPLPVGWYRIEFLDDAGAVADWTTAAVLAPLQAPAPADSPVALDVAAAWFARNDADQQAIHANLAALAGVRWVRDRMSWPELEPTRGALTPPPTTYDTAAAIQHEAGLRVLQVFHQTPEWAASETLDGRRRRGRFPRDLRDAYRFCRAMAERYRGVVPAWEPWNEANVDTFGAHTVDEMCSFQKAAWLGFKAGDPDVIVGWNAYTTVPTEPHARLIRENRAWPYFDTYNIHSYEWHHSYDELWPPAVEAACGRPIWLTEADRGMEAELEDEWSDHSPHNERLKAQYLAQAYASSQFAGVVKHFHFILGHYTEGKVQFGLLRRDFTPRPAYVTLAALGRLLAGGQCLGRWRPDPDGKTRVYAFRAWPDGRERDVLMVWHETDVDWPARGEASANWPLAADFPAQECYDYLGRPLDDGPPETIGGAPVFVIAPVGAADGLELEPAVQPGPYLEGAPSPVVLQAEVPLAGTVRVTDRPWSQAYAYGLRDDGLTTLTVHVYNFSDEPVRGTVKVSGVPEGWAARLVAVAPSSEGEVSVGANGVAEVSLAPMERASLILEIFTPAPGAEGLDGVVALEGDFGAAGAQALAMRFFNDQ